jgi:hypothetical protein
MRAHKCPLRPSVIEPPATHGVVRGRRGRPPRGVAPAAEGLAAPGPRPRPRWLVETCARAPDPLTCPTTSPFCYRGVPGMRWAQITQVALSPLLQCYLIARKRQPQRPDATEAQGKSAPSSSRAADAAGGRRRRLVSPPFVVTRRTARTRASAQPWAAQEHAGTAPQAAHARGRVRVEVSPRPGPAGLCYTHCKAQTATASTSNWGQICAAPGGRALHAARRPQRRPTSAMTTSMSATWRGGGG